MATVPLLPTDPTAVSTLDLINAHERPAVANHSIRTYLYAVLAAGERSLVAGRDYAEDLLFYACLLHDIGTADAYDGPQRFEVEGADAAATFLTTLGLGSVDVDQVWEAIALHTSAGIAERRGPITLLTRLGVRADFGASAPAEARALIEQRYPRLNIERELAAAVVAQAVRDPGKAPTGSWPGGLLAAHLANPDAEDNPAF